MNPVWLVLACAHTPEVPVIDITKPPTVAAVPDYTPPVPMTSALSNGAKVWVHAQPGLPLVSLRLVIPGGAAADPVDAPGTVSLSDAMLIRGAGERDANAFATEVERLALGLGTNTLGTATIVSLDAHSDQLDAGLDLLADMLLRPRFEDDDLSRLKEIRVGELTEAKDDAKTIAGWTLDSIYFGEGHPFAHPTDGTIVSVKGIHANDVRDSWAKRFGPENATFVVAGDITQEVILQKLEARFANWIPGERTKPSIAAPPLHKGDARYFLVDKPGTSQTALRVMMPAPTMNDPLSESAELGSIVLGGTFTSRLNQLLREEKGYTYGARSSYIAKANFGYLVASTNVQREVSAPALTDLLAELERYQDGIEDSELPKAQGAWQTQAVSSMGSRDSVAASFAALAVDDLPTDSLGTQLSIAKKATVKQVNAAIRASQIENAVVVVVGDLAKIQSDIEKALPVAWQVVHTD